jgi:hypothetical protein
MKINQCLNLKKGKLPEKINHFLKRKVAHENRLQKGQVARENRLVFEN